MLFRLLYDIALRLLLGLLWRLPYLLFMLVVLFRFVVCLQVVISCFAVDFVCDYEAYCCVMEYLLVCYVV